MVVRSFARVGALVAGASFGAITACSDESNSSTSTPPPDAGDAGANEPETGGPRTSGLPQMCERKAPVTERSGKCNGSSALCARTYDRVVTPMTHNAMSVVSEGFVVANQQRSIEKQLEDGIRGMMLDTYYFDGVDERALGAKAPDLSLPDQTYLCHGGCTLGRRRLLDGLCAITTFLDAHPDEVFSIIFENHVADPDTDAMLAASGLADFLYAHPDGTPWPTLGEMVESKKRLVVFLEQGGGSPPHLHSAWTGNVWDTPYTFNATTEFTCGLNRGAATNPLFLVNHWLSPPGTKSAAAANPAAVLGARLEKCTQEAGRPPTFVGVDFYDIGDLFPTVQKANGL